MAQWKKFLFHGIQPRINMTHLNSFTMFQSIWNQKTNEIFFGGCAASRFWTRFFPMWFLSMWWVWLQRIWNFFFFNRFSILSTEQIILLPNYYIFRCTILVWPRVCGCPFVCVKGKHHTWLLRSYSTSTNEARERPYNVKTVQLIYNSIQISLSYYN